MIRLQSSAEAVALRGRIPELAIERMRQFEGEDGLYDINTFSIFEVVVEFKAKERQGRFVWLQAFVMAGKDRIC